MDLIKHSEKLRTIAGIATVASLLLVFDVAFSAMAPAHLAFPLDERAPGEFPDAWIHGSMSAMDNDEEEGSIHVHAF